MAGLTGGSDKDQEQTRFSLNDDGSNPDCPVVISVIVLGKLTPNICSCGHLKNSIPAHSLGKTVKALMRTCVHASTCRYSVF